MACPFPCLLEPDPPPHAPFQDRRRLGRLDNHSAVRKLDLLLNLEPVEFFVGENWENRALFAQETFQGRLKALGEEIGEGYSWAHVMGNFPVMVSNEYIRCERVLPQDPVPGGWLSRYGKCGLQKRANAHNY